MISNLSHSTLSRAFSRILDSKKGQAPPLSPELKNTVVYEPKEADIAIKKTEQNIINKRTTTKKLYKVYRGDPLLLSL